MAYMYWLYVIVRKIGVTKIYLSYALEDCIYFMKNTVKMVILLNVILNGHIINGRWPFGRAHFDVKNVVSIPARVVE